MPPGAGDNRGSTPKTSQKVDAGVKCKTCGNDKPVGMIMRARAPTELEAELGISTDDADEGGHQITTTINPKVQKAAEDAGPAQQDVSDGRWPKTYQAAVVAIDPQNGRVLGYYGGDDATGTDYAGY